MKLAIYRAAFILRQRLRVAVMLAGVGVCAADAVLAAAALAPSASQRRWQNGSLRNGRTGQEGGVAQQPQACYRMVRGRGILQHSPASGSLLQLRGCCGCSPPAALKFTGGSCWDNTLYWRGGRQRLWRKTPRGHAQRGLRVTGACAACTRMGCPTLPRSILAT